MVAVVVGPTIAGGCGASEVSFGASGGVPYCFGSVLAVVILVVFIVVVVVGGGGGGSGVILVMVV